jgi:hypothetical protein
MMAHLLDARAGTASPPPATRCRRPRRAEVGHHHHIAGTYLVRYAQESAWREDHRRVDNGRQTMSLAGLAMMAPTSNRLVRVLAAEREGGVEPGAISLPAPYASLASG